MSMWIHRSVLQKRYREYSMECIKRIQHMQPPIIYPVSGIRTERQMRSTKLVRRIQRIVWQPIIYHHRILLLVVRPVLRRQQLHRPIANAINKISLRTMVSKSNDFTNIYAYCSCWWSEIYTPKWWILMKICIFFLHPPNSNLYRTALYGLSGSAANER